MGPALKEKKAEEEGELEVLQVGPSIVAPSGNQLWAIWCGEVFTHAGRWLGSRETTDGAGTKALERGKHWVLFLAKSGQRRACVKYVSFVIWLRGLCRGSGATWGAEYVEQAPGLHGIVDGSEGIMPTSRQ